MKLLPEGYSKEFSEEVQKLAASIDRMSESIDKEEERLLHTHVMRVSTVRKRIYTILADVRTLKGMVDSWYPV